MGEAGAGDGHADPGQGGRLREVRPWAGAAGEARGLHARTRLLPARPEGVLLQQRRGALPA